MFEMNTCRYSGTLRIKECLGLIDLKGEESIFEHGGMKECLGVWWGGMKGEHVRTCTVSTSVGSGMFGGNRLR